MLIELALIIIILILLVTEFIKSFILPQFQKKNKCENFSENELFNNNAIL